MTIGREDNFLNDGLENASPSQALLNWQISKGGTSINAGFDNSTPNSWFSHSFIGLNQTNKGGTLIGATLQLGIQALADFSENDNLHLGFINSNTDNFIYGSRIGKDGDAFSILNASWVAGSKTDLFFNLDSLPPNWQNTSSLITEMQNQGKLDLFIQDDTSVDYLRLNLHYLGTNNNDTFRGFDGNDTLEGGSGNDTLDGGDGNDSIIGGDGNDYLYALNGNDTIEGGSGNDYFWVDSLNDKISDSAGIDNVYSYITWSLENSPDFENLLLIGTNNINGTGNTGNNAIYGNNGNNLLSGGDGNDIFRGYDGNDTIYGGTGNDTIAGYNDDDLLYGEDGTDTINGGLGNDTLDGGSGNDTLDGGDGNDSIIGGDGNDYLYALNGNDTIEGGIGNDYFFVDSVNDQISDSGGIDNVYPYITWSLENSPDFENLLLRGTNNINGTGNTGNNAIYGNDGNNLLNGGSGIDTLTGGIGLDSFQFNYSSEGVDRIYDFVVADDTIVVSAAGFGGDLVAGAAITISQFLLGASATTTEHRFGYNSSTGSLWFDADGSGATTAVQFATLNTGLALTNTDIVVF